MSRAARCTEIAVPEDRRTRRGRELALHVAVFDALRPSARPDPVYFLAGGPGQAASAVAHAVVPALGPLRRERDLVLVDIRGTGRSAPLRCPSWHDAPPLSRVLDHRVPIGRVEACLRDLDADLSRYDTREIADDLDQVRVALGHGRVNLYGVSYGTRAALVWMRRHPEGIRSAVLDGVAPPQMRLFLPFARDAQAAFDRLVAACAASAACHRAFPDPAGDLDALLAGLPETPTPVQVSHPRTGAPVRVQVTRAGVAAVVRGLLYSADLQALLPLTLRAARAGDLGPLVAQALLLGETAEETTALGLMLSVVCSEDVDRIDPAGVPAAVSGTFLGDAMVREARALCAPWPRHRVPGSFFAPVRSTTPVLLLSGALDPVTPPRWAELAARTLPRARRVVVPSSGHGVWQSPCVGDLVRAFVGDPGGAALDLSCVEGLQRPPFFLSASGPAP